jgi:hypothetical protein
MDSRTTSYGTGSSFGGVAAAAWEPDAKPAMARRRGARCVLVTGLAGGREVFVGRSLGAGEGVTRTVEGKAVRRNADGSLGVQPFATTCGLAASGGVRFHDVTDGEACREIEDLLASPVASIARTTHPFTAGWIERALCADGGAAPRAEGWGTVPDGLHHDFAAGVRQLRTALCASPAVQTTRELDRLTEIECAVAGRVGRAVSQAVVQLHGLCARNGDLCAFLDAVHGAGGVRGAQGLSGWSQVMERAAAIRGWARRNGDAGLAREVHHVVRDGLDALCGVLLDGSAQLDTLAAETFNQLGVEAESGASPPAWPGWAGADPSNADEIHEFAGTGAFTGSVA